MGFIFTWINEQGLDSRSIQEPLLFALNAAGFAVTHSDYCVKGVLSSKKIQ